MGCVESVASTDDIAYGAQNVWTKRGPGFAVTAGSGFFGFGWVDSSHHLWGDTYSDGHLELHEPLKPSGISSHLRMESLPW